MKVIGLTGGIGSGKSSVSRKLARLGARIIDADEITHQLEQRGQPVWNAIHQAFGWSVMLADGHIDRKRLGRLVFSNEGLRRRLNGIVHPAVQAQIHQEVERARSQGVKVVVLDVPLLIEGGLYRMVDEVWVVYADSRQQVERICRRDKVSEETAWRRIRAQMPLEDKLPYATQVIDNRQGERRLEEVVQALWQSVGSNGRCDQDS